MEKKNLEQLKQYFNAGIAFALGTVVVLSAIGVVYAYTYTPMTATLTNGSPLNATTMNQIIDNINFLNDKVNALGAGGGCYWDYGGTCVSGFVQIKTASYGFCGQNIGTTVSTSWAYPPGGSCGGAYQGSTGTAALCCK